MINEYATVMTKTESVSPSLFSFVLERPDEFDFKAGQYVFLCLEKDIVRSKALTMVSAPHEPTLQFITRLRPESDYKQRLANLEPGALVKIKGPYGMFTTDHLTQTTVFLAGGVGVTPFISILRELRHHSTFGQVMLFHSFRNQDDWEGFRIFFDDLWPSFQYVPLVTRENPARFLSSAHHGRLTSQILQQHLLSINNQKFFISGKPDFVVSMLALLENMGVSLDAIKLDTFIGYEH